MSNLSTQPYKGTRDFYPEDMRVRNWMFDRVRQTLRAFGYEEYDGPMLESFDLYAAKTSDEIVNEQLYWLTDRGERKLVIRPEMTPTLARMVAAKQNELPKPIRWFSIPNLWRYERPQRGRLREHWQLNVDTFGGDQLSEDLEICQVIVALMNGFGAKDGFEVRLNHRALTDFVFRQLVKIDGEKIAVIGRLVDAAPKMGRDAFKTALEKEGMTTNQIDLLMGMSERDHPIQSSLRANSHFEYIDKLMSGLTKLGIGQHFRYDLSIMRGFMYYTGMVLEVYDTHPDNNRALFGGGRYDNLVGMFGGAPLSGVGFGMGDVTLRNFLDTHKLLPDMKAARGVYVAHLGDDELLEAQKLAQYLRSALTAAGLAVPVMTSLSPDKPRKIFTTAEKLGARAVVFVGSDDVQAQRFPMKDLVSGEQIQGTASELLEACKRL